MPNESGRIIDDTFYPFSELCYGDRIELIGGEGKLVLDVVKVFDTSRMAPPVCMLTDDDQDRITAVQLIGWRYKHHAELQNWAPIRLDGLHPGEGRLLYHNTSSGQEASYYVAGCRITRDAEIVFESANTRGI